MKMKFIYLHIFLCTFVLAQNTNTDTLYINEKAVIFYYISQNEYNSSRDTTNYELDELISDFNFYYYKIANDPQLDGLKILLTTKSYITFNTGNRYTFYRKSEKSICGLILFDGNNEPKLFSGVDTDIGWLSTIKKFFKL